MKTMAMKNKILQNKFGIDQFSVSLKELSASYFYFLNIYYLRKVSNLGMYVCVCMSIELKFGMWVILKIKVPFEKKKIFLEPKLWLRMLYAYSRIGIEFCTL